MGLNTQHKEVGGGAATPLAEDFVNMLQQAITGSGSFGGVTAGQRANGADPVGSTGGVMGILANLLSGGAGEIGGSMSEMITKQADRDVNALRERFSVGGGASFGTPAAYAESLLRSETAPKLTQAVGGLQMQALSQLLPIIAGISGRGISQRENIASPGAGASAIATLAPIAGTAIGAIAGGPPGAAAGGAAGNAVGGAFAPVSYGGGPSDLMPAGINWNG